MARSDNHVRRRFLAADLARDGHGEAEPVVIGVRRYQEVGHEAVDGVLLASAEQNLGSSGDGLDRQRGIDDEEGAVDGRNCVRASTKQKSELADVAYPPGGRSVR